MRISHARTCPSLLPAIISTVSGGISRLVMEDVGPLSVCSGSRVCARISHSMTLASNPAVVSYTAAP